MADNLQDRRPQDALRINVHEDWERSYWTKALGVTAQEVEDAVKAVGVQATAVKQYLASRSKSAPQH
jgi:hypothetical protein